MVKKATLPEILDIAMANEEKGARFYSHMARSSAGEKIRAVFERLSAEELEHREAFAKLLKAEGGGEEIGEEEGKLLHSLISTSVFHSINDESLEVMSPSEALAVGIQAEKDSILLYQGIFNQSKSQAVRDRLSLLLEEEKRHLVELREQMEDLQQN